MPTCQDTILQVEKLSKRYGGLVAIDDVSLAVKAGEVHAVVGENGAGKSTLMKILGGIISRDSGQIVFKGRSVYYHTPLHAMRDGIAVIHQELSVLPHLNVMENIFMGRLDSRWGHVLWRRLHEKSLHVLNRVGLKVDPRARVGDLSIAQRQLVEIAKALSVEASLVIMDEPNSSLTSAETTRLFEVIAQLKRQGLSIIYVSHKIEEVLAISDRISVLRDGRYVGTIDKADATADSVIQMMVGRNLDRVHRRSPPSDARVRLEVRGLTGKRFADVSFCLRRGEILGFAGLVGAGRSEVVRAVFGADKYDSGQVLLDGQSVHFKSPQEAIRAGLAIVPEDRKVLSLFMELPIRFNMSLAVIPRLSTMGVIRRRSLEMLLSHYKDRLDIKMPSLRHPVSSLSGGNQQKTVLARWLATDPKVLILDEPTHGVDVGAKAEIYKLMQSLTEDGISIILISSEMAELIAMSDRVIVMHEGRVTGELGQESLTEDAILAHATGIRTNNSAANGPPRN